MELDATQTGPHEACFDQRRQHLPDKPKDTPGYPVPRTIRTQHICHYLMGNLLEMLWILQHLTAWSGAAEALDNVHSDDESEGTGGIESSCIDKNKVLNEGHNPAHDRGLGWHPSTDGLVTSGNS